MRDLRRRGGRKQDDLRFGAGGGGGRGTQNRGRGRGRERTQSGSVERSKRKTAGRREPKRESGAEVGDPTLFLLKNTNI